MSSVSTSNTYTLGTILNEVVDKNLRMFPILFKMFKHLQYVFFDIKQLTWEGWMTMKMKELPWIEPTITVDGYSVKWLDYSLFDFNTEVKGDQSITLSSFSASFDVDDTSGFAVNDTVYFIANDAGTSDTVDWIVTAVTDSDTIVVNVNAVNWVAATTSNAITLKDNAKVERGFWKRNDNEEITRPSSTYKYNEYHSYVQHFGRRIEFTKAELNKEYKYEWEAKNEAAKRFQYNLWIIFQEVNKAIYKGKNVAPGSGAQDKMEMLGLEEICRQCGTISDLSSATDPLESLFGIFETAFQSGSVLWNEPIILLVNDKFISNLSRANADKVRFDKVVENLEYTLPTISTPFGEVEIVRDPMLNRLYNYSVAFTLPRSLVKLRVRENQTFEPKGWITKADQSIRIYNVIHNLREKDLYDMELELWLIAWGMSEGTRAPYQMIKKFAVS